MWQRKAVQSCAWQPGSRESELSSPGTNYTSQSCVLRNLLPSAMTYLPPVTTVNSYQWLNPTHSLIILPLNILTHGLLGDISFLNHNSVFGGIFCPNVHGKDNYTFIYTQKRRDSFPAHFMRLGKP